MSLRLPLSLHSFLTFSIVSSMLLSRWRSEAGNRFFFLQVFYSSLLIYYLLFFYFLLLFLLLLCREILSETNDIVNNISWQAISSSPHFCRGLYCMKFVESFQFILFHVEVQFSNGIFVFMHNFFHNSLLFLFICFWYCNFLLLLLLLLSCTTFYFWLLRSKVLPLFISQVIENFIYL